MGCSSKIPAHVPEYFTNAWFFIFGCIVVSLCEAMETLDFPGSVTCLNDEILVRKPKGFRLNAWQTLHIVDSTGGQILDCGHFVDGKTLTVPYKCAEYQTGSHIIHIAFSKGSVGQRLPSYRISCDGLQADDPRGAVVTCTQDSMTVKIPRTLSGFDDEMPVSAPSFWNLEVKFKGRTTLLSTSDARQKGYQLSSDPYYLTVKASYSAFGLNVFSMDNKRLYVGDLRLVSQFGSPEISIDTPMICARDPPTCNSTHATVLIPFFGGVLSGINVNSVDIQLSSYYLQQHGITLDSRNGYRLYIKRSTLKGDGKDFLVLTFSYYGKPVPMLILLVCSGGTKDPAEHADTVSACTLDGYMDVEVVSTLTKPELNLTTVKLRDGTCQPSQIANNFLRFHVPLNGCGTTVKIVGTRVFYENEIHALWKDFPPRRISRDSEFRQTVRCYYSTGGNASVIVNVLTLPPPVSARTDGPLTLVLNMYPDVSYGTAYSNNQYPVVKTLLDPIFLEVQVLNRNDPNIDLVLHDCWATMTPNQNSSPQWNVVVNGCQEQMDNLWTVFHPVGLDVARPSHRKRFEVKTFAFVLGGDTSSNLVYFHCHAIICNKLAPDFSICSKTCSAGRRKRDELSTYRKTSTVSLPGPVLVVDLESSIQHKDHTSPVGHLAVGSLSVLGFVAMAVFALLLRSVFKRKSINMAH
ncbi:zona pellucida sperm-binding protein 2 [Xenopus tropicalis]|uniref:Egg envelope component ZPA n=1 Tax=Xenopus tropicalis TaxID=8364 RepID=Q8AWX5_XENTR|nr:zona pellucida sperm-binding protein 2 [Xenopus tropicalis]AAL86570.1 egg envelope component ZPA [Xenopus tropicalis]|eukprot:NP_988855.1 zona pellucida sperm-binding protein 2 [Xenopus tropicalis]